MSARPRLLVAVATLLATSVLGTTASAATGVPREAGPLTDQIAPQIGGPISDAELEDLQSIAAQKGLSLRQATKRYAWNDDFALAVAEVRRVAPEAFAHAEIIDADNVWLAYAADAPSAAHQVMNDFRRQYSGVAVDIRQGWGYTERALQAGIEGVHEALLVTPGVRTASTSYDVEARTIRTAVVLEQGADAGRLPLVARTGLERAAGRSAANRILTSVVASKHLHLGGNDSSSNHHGGEAITGCTSGFGTMTSGGVRGISTAGHCGDSQADDGSTLTFRLSYRGTHGDFQLHTGPQAETDDFYAGSSTALEVSLRDVSGVGAPVVGQSLCKNGRVGFQDCQEVRKLDVCFDGDCNMVQMGSRLAEGGDSGGPVYWGNTAYGLHKGYHYDPVFPYDRDLFSRADRIDNALNTNIATS